MVLGIEFAPLSIPFRRRRQTAAVIFFISVFLLGHVSSWLVIISFGLIPIFTPLVVAYLFWVFYWDRETPFRGGRPFKFMKLFRPWKYFRDYFPVKLRRTVPLDEGGTYIFGCHPHGLASVGAVCNLATHVTGFDEKFPGIDLRMLTLDMQFDMPIWREVLMAQGMASVSKKSCCYCLENGISIGIVIGGAAEALDARPGSADLTLASRRGFIKMAMLSGATLVPTFSFGENDLYNQFPNPPGSRLRTLQTKFTKTMGFSPPLVHGRGVFNYTFGLMPFRHPVTTVVGKPVAVTKVADPDNLDSAEVDRIWELYVEGLREVFNTHKVEFGFQDSDELNII